MLKQDIAWCPGCGDFPIRATLEKVLKELPVPGKDIVLTSGIGQAAKLPHYLLYSYFNGLHGPSLPLAVGVKLARPDLTVIAVSGDGCQYGEGGNHFIHTIRRRLDITILACDNKVYALTKGQSSPTTDAGMKNALDPQGNLNTPLDPLAMALIVGAPFVARTFAGDPQHMESGHAQPWPRVLDYGCGSGILAIGASLHAARNIDAVDIDPAAVAATRANALANRAVLNAGAPDQARGAYALVLANILAKPLVLLAPLLAMHVAPGGHLVLAGILDRQVSELREAYAPWLALDVHDSEEGWVLMVGHRSATPAAVP